MKTFSQNLAKFTLLVILATFLYLPGSIKIAHADDSAVCKWINAQNGSSGGSGPDGKPIQLAAMDTSLKPGTAEYKAAQTKRINDYLTAQQNADAALKTAAGSTYASKLVVITEEPLGTATPNFSTNCARVTKCSSGLFDANNVDKNGQSAPIRKCFTSYDFASSCSSVTPPDAATLRDPTQSFEYCEIVQVYFSDGGTSLLYGYIGAIYRYVAVLGGFIAVLVLIIAGVMRSASGDNPEMMGKANQLVVRVITGLVVLFLSAVILYTINPNFFVL